MKRESSFHVATVRCGKVVSARSPAIAAALQGRLDRDGASATFAFLSGKDRP